MNWGDDATQLWASLYGEGDVDWYQFIATDTFGARSDRAPICSTSRRGRAMNSTTASANGEPIELKGLLIHEEATNADGLSGAACRSR